jgi:hypothetical protein
MQWALLYWTDEPLTPSPWENTLNNNIPGIMEINKCTNYIYDIMFTTPTAAYNVMRNNCL